MTHRRIQKRMYAVSKEGIGLIAGTLSYSRRAAIAHFLGSGASNPHAWSNFKSTGYRTVMAQVKIVRRTLASPSQARGGAAS